MVKCVAQSLVRVNEVIVNQLKTGERLDEVKMKFQQLVGPAVAIHQHCDISKNDALTRLVFILFLYRHGRVLSAESGHVRTTAFANITARHSIILAPPCDGIDNVNPHFPPQATMYKYNLHLQQNLRIRARRVVYASRRIGDAEGGSGLRV